MQPVKRKVSTLFLTLAVLAFAACANGAAPDIAKPPETMPPISSAISLEEQPPSEEVYSTKRIHANADVRNLSDFGDSPPKSYTLKEGEYDPEDIPSFMFNEGTMFEGSEAFAREIMENAKNPGIGVRGLHEQGITGKGVNVAIIDDHLFPEHPEYEGKIALFHNTDVDAADKGSFHGPAVTSLLVGNDIGTAPDATVYYVAIPTGEVDGVFDSQYDADAIIWIVEQNKKLPISEKIRVISLSAIPDKPGRENRQAYRDAVMLAESEGILVIDADSFVWSAYHDYGDDPEDERSYKAGYPIIGEQYLSPDKIAAPASLRTTAEHYRQDSPSYIYHGNGGISWAVPYTAGVLALGWQVNPALDKDKMVELLFDTAYKNSSGANIINPPAFIEAVQKTLM